MFKPIIIAAAFAGFLAQPVFAEDAASPGTPTACNEASMMKLQTDLDTVKDEAMKTAAMKEMDMAKEAMAAKNDAECTTHMDNAMKAMKAS